MTTLATLLVLASALLHVTWNMLAKRSGDKLAFMWAVNLVAIAVYAPAFLWFLYHNSIPREGWPFIVATGLIHCVYIASLAKAYAHGALSLAYPISRGTGVAIVPLLAIPLLGEQISLAGGVGITMVVAGILALHARPLLSMIGGPLGIVAARAESVRGQRLGTLFALITGLSIAGYSLVDKAGVARVHPMVYGYLIFVGMTIGLTPWVMSRLRPAIINEWRRNRSAILAGGVLVLGTYLIVLGAMRIAPVSYIVPLREVSVLMAAVMGVAFLGEEFSRERLIGSICILTGVLTISILG